MLEGFKVRFKVDSGRPNFDQSCLFCAHSHLSSAKGLRPQSRKREGGSGGAGGWIDGMEPDDDVVCKLELPFILNDQPRVTRAAARAARAVAMAACAPKPEPKPEPKPKSKPEARRLSREEKKRKRTCKVEGCGNYIVHKGVCCRHGVR